MVGVCCVVWVVFGWVDGVGLDDFVSKVVRGCYG